MEPNHGSCGMLAFQPRNMGDSVRSDSGVNGESQICCRKQKRNLPHEDVGRSRNLSVSLLAERQRRFSCVNDWGVTRNSFWRRITLKHTRLRIGEGAFEHVFSRVPFVDTEEHRLHEHEVEGFETRATPGKQPPEQCAAWDGVE